MNIELIKNIQLSKIDINEYKDLEDEKKFIDLNDEISDISKMKDQNIIFT